MSELLESRWQETKSALLEGLQGTKKSVMASTLENTRKYLSETATAGATSAGNVATLNRVILPVIRRPSSPCATFWHAVAIRLESHLQRFRGRARRSASLYFFEFSTRRLIHFSAFPSSRPEAESTFWYIEFFQART